MSVRPWDAARKARDDAAADPYDIDERFRVDGPRKRQRVETYKEVWPGICLLPRHPTSFGPSFIEVNGII